MEINHNNKDDSRDKNVYAAPESTPVVEKKKKGFTLVELFVVLAIIGILIGMFMPLAGRGSHEGARRTICLNNVRQISLAMHNYESANGHFPPAYIADENGKPMHSWRVLLLPYIEQNALYEKYNMDEPWDGPNNSKLHDEIVLTYRCPSSRSEEHCSDFVLITGKGTGFDADQTIRFGDITDGSSNTIMVTEVYNSDFHWMKPQDISVDQLLSPMLEEVATNHPGTRNFALFDGSTHAITNEIPAAELGKLALIADGEVVDVTDW